MPKRSVASEERMTARRYFRVMTWLFVLCVVPATCALWAPDFSRPKSPSATVTRLFEERHEVARSSPSFRTRRVAARMPAAAVPRRRSEPGAPDAGVSNVAWQDQSRSWNDQKPDADWTENVAAYFSSLLDALAFDPGVIERTECRQRTCRLVVSTKDVGVLQTLSAAAGGDGLQWTQEFVDQTDGRHLFVYIPRESWEMRAGVHE